MSFQEFKLNIEAILKAYHEETSHRIRKLEETLQDVSSQQARCTTESHIPKARVDHDYWASAKNAMPLKYLKIGAFVPSYTTREFAPSIFLHSPSASACELVGHLEDMELCDAMHIPRRLIFLLSNSAVIINDFAGGKGDKPWRETPGYHPKGGSASGANASCDRNLSMGRNRSQFAPLASDIAGGDGSDSSGSRFSTPRSTSPVPSSSSNSSSSSGDGNKQTVVGVAENENTEMDAHPGIDEPEEKGGSPKAAI